MKLHERIIPTLLPVVAVGSIAISGCSSEPAAPLESVYQPPQIKSGQYTSNRNDWRTVTFFSRSADTYSYLDIPRDRDTQGQEPLPKSFLYTIICGQGDPIIQTTILDTPEEKDINYAQVYEDVAADIITVAETKRTVLKGTVAGLPLCDGNVVNRSIATLSKPELFAQRLQRVVNGDSAL